jgi:hypothetical protein
MTISTDKFFYHKLPSFDDFKGITHDEHYFAVPNDWIIVVADIKDSTKAIEEGKYKDVNTIGAASIVSAHNAMGELEFPYVFGGDGATFLAPKLYQARIEKELKALKEIAKRGFALDLRIGIIKVDEILKQGASIEVAKFKLIGQKSVAIFKGGGITLAEKKIKSELDKYEIKGRIKHMIDLNKLSCRWNAIPAKRGKNLSLLVQVTDKNNMSIYHDVLQKLEEIYEGKLDDANPVNFEQLSYKSFTECYKNEKRLHSTIWSMAFVKRISSIFLSVLLFKIGLPRKVFNPEPYIASMGTHSDYRKFDDMLRMTIDCSPKQIEQISEYLVNLHQQGDIYYGMHTSDNSIMTCFVDGLSMGNHIHFIDGDNGGFAMAAKGLKEQQNQLV